MQITVSATAESQHSPTRAIVHVRVQAQDASAAAASSHATALSTELTSSITSLAATAIDSWSNDALTTWSNRPWKDDGTQSDPVFYASISYRVTFTDFTALATWLAHISPIEGIDVQGVSWELSPEETTSATSTVQQQAVVNARTKAETYAHAAGYNSVCFVEVADTGLLSQTGAAGFDGGPSLARAAMFKESGSVDIKPEDVVISASVHARFTAKRTA